MIRIAICHADQDERHLNALETQLARAERVGQISIWDRSRIPFGSEKKREIDQSLAQAEIIVLLLSADLLASREEDVDLAMRQKARGALVLPVLVRPVLLDERFAGLRVLPGDNAPISAQKADADEQWVAVAQEILRRLSSPPAAQQQQSPEPPSLKQKPPLTEIKILFMGANPTDATRLALDREVREIGDRIKSAQKRDRLPISQEHAVPLHELQQILLHHEPAILHFSGHGTKDGRLVFLSRSGTGAPAPPEAIASLLAICVEDGLRCVILNACYAEEQARLIAEHVECVVGISGEIKDKSAIAFTAGFYTGLAEGRTVQRAFDLGKNQMHLMGEPHADRLRLHCKPGVDPRTLKLV